MTIATPVAGTVNRISSPPHKPGTVVGFWDCGTFKRGEIMEYMAQDETYKVACHGMHTFPNIVHKEDIWLVKHN